MNIDPGMLMDGESKAFAKARLRIEIVGRVLVDLATDLPQFDEQTAAVADGLSALLADINAADAEVIARQANLIQRSTAALEALTSAVSRFTGPAKG